MTGFGLIWLFEQIHAELCSDNIMVFFSNLAWRGYLVGQDFGLHRHIILLFWFACFWRTILFSQGSHLGISVFVCVAFFFSTSHACTHF